MNATRNAGRGRLYVGLGFLLTAIMLGIASWRAYTTPAYTYVAGDRVYQATVADAKQIKPVLDQLDVKMQQALEHASDAEKQDLLAVYAWHQQSRDKYIRQIRKFYCLLLSAVLLLILGAWCVWTNRTVAHFGR